MFAISVIARTLTALGEAGLLVGCNEAARWTGCSGPRGTGRSRAFRRHLKLEGGKRVKLAGIDVPQGDAPYATAAQQALQQLLTGRRAAPFFSGARKDALGRTVAQVEDAESRRWIEGALLDRRPPGRTRVANRAPAAAMLAREAAARRA